MMLPARTRVLLTAATLACIAGIGWVDYLTPQTYSFSLLFLVPTVGAAWLLGRGAGVVVAVASAAAWLFAEVAWGLRIPVSARAWNTFSRLAIFVAAALVADRLRRDRDRLRELLSHETTARIATLEQLRHRDRLATVGTLASGLAHELGTPLNVVAGRAHLIATTPQIDAAAADSARIIVEQARRMTAIIRQLLDFARRRGPGSERVDLVELARRTVELLLPLARARRVDLALAGDAPSAAGPIAARADHAQLQQALSNLVMNGIQSMAGGGALRVEVGAQRMKPPDEHGGDEGDFAYLRVIDHGSGIPAEQVAKIFDPFFTTKPVGEGTGLGLSISYGIVRDHGGWIGVQSEVGRGSRFSIYLPAAAGARSASEEAA